MKTDIHLQKKMISLFHESGFQLTDEQYNQFWKYYTLIAQYNEECDLTRIKKFDDIIIKHFIDSIYITKLCPLPDSIVDIGTGAGFPGVPLKIVKPKLSLTLAEPRHKRVFFLRKICEVLGFTTVEIYPHKVTENSFFKGDAVITRALESTDVTLARVYHFLPEGGQVLLLKGPGAGDELETLSQTNSKSYELMHDKSYTLPGTTYHRRLLVFRKTTSEIRIRYRIFHDSNENIAPAITSSDNRFFKEARKITSAEKIRKTEKSIASGKKLIKETIQLHSELGKELIIYDGYSEDDTDINKLVQDFAHNKKLHILKKALYNELDIFNTKGPLLLVAVPAIPEWDCTLTEGCALLLPFQDPANTGAVIRSAVGFGIQKIILLRESAHPFHPRSIRTSGGAVFRAPLFKGPSLSDLPALVREHNIPLVTLDKEGESINSFTFPDKFLMLPGLEGPGLPGPLKAHALAIPISENIESLNAAIAASIGMYQWRCRIK